MNKQQQEDLDEANAILDFQYKRITLKEFAIYVVCMIATYIFFVGLVEIFQW